MHGIGLFWGFNIFLNQRIRIEVEITSNGTILGTEEFRTIVLNDFKAWAGWKSRANYDVLKESVSRASSVAEILRLLISK